jgi:hypothetical protein
MQGGMEDNADARIYPYEKNCRVKYEKTQWNETIEGCLEILIINKIGLA